MEVRDIVQEAVIKTIPKKKKCKKAKWLSEEALQKIFPFECGVPKIARRDKKAFLSDQCKEIEENNTMGKISSRKLEISKENFRQRWFQ